MRLGLGAELGVGDSVQRVELKSRKSAKTLLSDACLLWVRDATHKEFVVHGHFYAQTSEDSIVKNTNNFRRQCCS